MNTKRLIALLGTLICLAAPLVATAATITFDPPGAATEGDWDDPDNWDLGRIPADGDHVVIPSGLTCTVNISNAVCDSFDVDGTLKIANAAVLTIDHDSTLDGGGLRLLGATSKLRIYFPDGPGGVIISGSGKIDCDDGRIEITGEPAGLISRVEITGTVDIYGEGGQFVNEGTVVVDTGLISVDTFLGYTDSPGDRWIVKGAGGALIFGHSILQQEDIRPTANYQLIDNVNSSSVIRFESGVITKGRLEMEGGYLDIRENVVMGDDTAGRHMQATGGKIVVDAGKQFQHK